MVAGVTAFRYPDEVGVEAVSKLKMKQMLNAGGWVVSIKGRLKEDNFTRFALGSCTFSHPAAHHPSSVVDHRVCLLRRELARVFLRRLLLLVESSPAKKLGFLFALSSETAHLGTCSRASLFLLCESSPAIPRLLITSSRT